MKKCTILKNLSIVIMASISALCQAKSILAPDRAYPKQVWSAELTKQQKENIVLNLQRAYGRIKKAKEAGPNEYFGGETPALAEYSRLEKKITSLGGKIVRRGSTVTVIWSK